MKVRSSVRRQTWLRRLGLALGGLFALVLGLFLSWRGIEWVLQETVYRNPAFALHQFDVQTDGVIPIEQLRSWSGVKLRDNLLALDLTRVQRDLEMVPAIDTVEVERVLPHTLRIRVAERIPVARLIFPAPPGSDTNEPPTIYTLDAAGYFMFPVEPSQANRPPGHSVAHLPVLTGVPLNDVRPGRQTESPRLQAALQVLRSFGRSPMSGVVDLKEIDVASSGFLTVTTGQHCVVLLGLKNFEDQFGRWRSVFDHGQRVGRNLAWMDLSVSNNVPLLWLEASIVPEPPSRSPRTSGYKKRNV